jgi:CBS domain containing-hemolysin-like protein
LALVVVTYLHVVFGELTPKAAALNHPEALARWLAPPLLFFAWITTPFTYFLNRSSQVILRLLGQEKAGSEEAVHSPEEIRLLVEQSQESGQMGEERPRSNDAAYRAGRASSRSDTLRSPQRRPGKRAVTLSGL